VNQVCPSCTQPVAPGDVFCEACGAQLTANASLVSDVDLPDVAAQEVPVPGTVDGCLCVLCCDGHLVDGYCDRCGGKAPSARDHWREQPVPKVGGVSDRGVVHTRNEDAMAVAALADGSFTALVVCDGVTTAPESDRASLAAARAACAALAAHPRLDTGSLAELVNHWTAALVAACALAHAEAVAVARTLGDPPEPPSCTFVAVVELPQLAVAAWVGDSRAYWLPDDGPPVQISVDHSLGSEAIRSGLSRHEAESDPAFHTITRWLGADSVDPTPDTASTPLAAEGWLVVCSDGLWNYASSPEQLNDVVRRLATENSEPLALAASLVRWANEQGGHDNITALVSRHCATIGTLPPAGGASGG
jgi:serine/threonine protein phosphatase PrpC